MIGNQYRAENLGRGRSGIPQADGADHRPAESPRRRDEGHRQRLYLRHLGAGEGASVRVGFGPADRQPDRRPQGPAGPAGQGRGQVWLKLQRGPGLPHGRLQHHRRTEQTEKPAGRRSGRGGGHRRRHGGGRQAGGQVWRPHQGQCHLRLYRGRPAGNRIRRQGYGGQLCAVGRRRPGRDRPVCADLRRAGRGSGRRHPAGGGQRQHPAQPAETCSHLHLRLCPLLGRGHRPGHGPDGPEYAGGGGRRGLL